VTGIWAGSSLHYIQVLSEDRWEDYEWEHKSERYSYWGHGTSWIEEPEQDPLGAGRQDMIESMTTIPKKDSDLSFYLWKSDPLPDMGLDKITRDEVEEPLAEGLLKDVGNGHLKGFGAAPASIDALGTCISVPL